LAAPPFDGAAFFQTLRKGNVMTNRTPLAVLALEMTNRDVAAAARLLAEWCGTSVEFAITAIDELMLDDVPPAEFNDLDEPR
jgi:hypothetical protein